MHTSQHLKCNYNSVILRMSKEPSVDCFYSTNFLIKLDDTVALPFTLLLSLLSFLQFPSWLLVALSLTDTHWLLILLVIKAVFIITVTDFMKFCIFDKSYNLMLQSVVFVYAVYTLPETYKEYSSRDRDTL